MRGSWIGLVLGILILFLLIDASVLQEYDERYTQYEIQMNCVSTPENQCVIIEKPKLIPLFFLESVRENALSNFIGSWQFVPIIGHILLVIFYTLPILGFLIGWKIHFFMRKKAGL